MSSLNLSCADCRVRVRASAPEIDVLEGDCPICGAPLQAGATASSLIGFRSFDLDALSDHAENDRPPPTYPEPVDLVARRNAASAAGQLGVGHLPDDDGGGVGGRALAERLPAH